MIPLTQVIMWYKGIGFLKNTKGAFAMLDAMSEEINNNIYSKGHRAIGMSSRLTGSGWQFLTNYIRIP
jgi:hypothetical protein